MAVIDVRLMSAPNGFQSGRQRVEYKYSVETSDMADTDADVAAAVVADADTRLDLVGTFVLTDLNVDRKKEHPLFWDVTLSVASMNWPDSQPNPLLRESVFSSSYDEQTESYFLDSASTPKAVVNSVGERFETFPLRLTGTPILQVVKNFASYAMVAYDEIKYTTNASAITIRGTTYSADTLLFKPPLVQEVVENVGGVKYHYFVVTFRLAGDHARHRDNIDDRGYHQKTPAGFIVSISLSNQTLESPNTPWPLDGHGVAKPNWGDVPANLPFQPYPSVEWGIDFD